MMLFVSLGLIALAVALGYSSISPATPLPSSVSVAIFGTGLFLSCFAAMMLFTRETAASIQLREQQGTLRLCDALGACVDIPAFGLLRAIQPVQPGGSSSGILGLQKRDGGVIELAPINVAQQTENLTTLLSQAISRMQRQHAERGDGWATDSNHSQPAIKGVTIHHTADAISFQWRAGGPLRRLLIAGGPLGLGIVFLAFADEAQFTLLVGAGVMFALAALAIAQVLIDQAVSCRVRVAEGRVTVTRRRFGRVIRTQRTPVGAVIAVDYVHRLNANGAVINLRRKRLSDTLEAFGEPGNNIATFRASIALVKSLNSGIKLPCGNLSLASKIALDLALSQAVARASARLPSEL